MMMMMMMMMVVVVVIIIIIIIIIIIMVCSVFCSSYKWRIFSTSVTRLLTGTKDSVTTDVQCNIYSWVPAPLKHWINIKLCSIKRECRILSGSTDIFEMCFYNFTYVTGRISTKILLQM